MKNSCDEASEDAAGGNPEETSPGDGEDDATQMQAVAKAIVGLSKMGGTTNTSAYIHGL